MQLRANKIFLIAYKTKLVLLNLQSPITQETQISE